MRKTIKNHQLKIKNSSGRAGRIFILLCAFCVFAGNAAAQTDFARLNEQIARGNDEQKRDALFQIRNLATADAARLAVPALKDESEIVRATAAFSIVFLPAVESLEHLSPLLKDKKELVRREAAYALGKTGNSGAINNLVHTIETDKIADVKNACVVALGEIGDVSAIGELNIILQRKPREADEFTRRSAARSTGQIAQIIQTGKRGVLTPEDFLPDTYKTIEKPKYQNLVETFPAFRAAQMILIEMLQNARETDDARREAAFALGAIGGAAAISVLQSNSNARDYYLARICAEALRKINSSPER